MCQFVTQAFGQAVRDRYQASIRDAGEQDAAAGSWNQFFTSLPGRWPFLAHWRLSCLAHVSVSLNRPTKAF